VIVKRRTFVISGAAVIVAGGALRIALSDKESAVAKILHKRLPYLSLDSAGVAQFAKDAVAHDVIAGTKLRFLDGIGPLYTRFDRSPGKKQNGDIRRGEERLVGEYLLSSDFFRNGADETRVVRYLGFYDGSKDISACSNPFARPVLPASA
jgi:hypothetical protein